MYFCSVLVLISGLEGNISLLELNWSYSTSLQLFL
uniref:Uncharacterized protein n=1 Tax=Aegilops tauschii subsp. strangulata TaxID=200361 RepID=A0A452ZAQ5_AEGTS